MGSGTCRSRITATPGSGKWKTASSQRLPEVVPAVNALVANPRSRPRMPPNRKPRLK
jgi:hypothetical protein